MLVQKWRNGNLGDPAPLETQFGQAKVGNRNGSPQQSTANHPVAGPTASRDGWRVCRRGKFGNGPVPHFRRTHAGHGGGCVGILRAV